MLVLVLSYRGLADTLACLATLRAQHGSAADVLVVDNASGEAEVAAIRAAFPEVEVLALPRNEGFAGGNNAGIRLALERGYESVLLLNNDTLLPPDTLAAMQACLERTGPCLLHPVVLSGPGEAPQLDPAEATGAPHRIEAVPGRPELFEMNFAYGACLLVPAEVFRRVGLLDERLFLQLEETDLFRRARKAGYRAYCTTDARIEHRMSPSFGGARSPMKTYYATRNTLLAAERLGLRGWLGAARQLVWSLQTLAGETGGPATGRWGFLLWLWRADRFAVAARAGLRDYARRRFGAAPPRTLERLRRT